MAQERSSASRTQLESEILDLTNEVRTENKLPRLQWHRGLAGIANRHAILVAEGQAPFSHSGAHQRFAACSTKCINVAENLARSDGFVRDELPRAAVSSWCQSEGHRRNLLGPFDVCGIGWAASDSGVIFVTQLLALLDERSNRYCLLRERTFEVATSTPAICGAIGFALAGPIVAIGTGIVGTAIDYKYGVKPKALPAVLRDRVRGMICKRHVCSSCGAQPDGELLASGGDGRLWCDRCHPAPSDSSNWCFVD